MKQHLYGQKNRASNYMILSVTRFDPPALHHIKNEMPEGISFFCVNEEGVRTPAGSSNKHDADCNKKIIILV